MFSYTRDGWPSDVGGVFRYFWRRKEELSIKKGCLLWGIRVLVPIKLQDKLLEELYQDHPGMSRMKAVARSYMWWPGLDKSIENKAGSCSQCQAVRHQPPVAPLHPWCGPEKLWQCIHVDFVGPFQGTMFLVTVDVHSKWPEVSMVSSITVSKTMGVLRQMFAAYGLPDQIISDNGPQFISDHLATFTKMNGM